ncbi:MAG: hypothetical protein WBW33_02745 [Bryobacteraceae bacterium]
MSNRKSLSVEEGDDSGDASNLGLLTNALQRWAATETSFAFNGRTYSAAEQSANEGRMDVCLHTVESLLRGLRTKGGRATVRERIAAAFVEFAKPALGLDDCHIALLLDNGFAQMGGHLGRYARRFDASVSSEDLFQACRNAWVACGLQSLFGDAMVVTPSIFAYSMLYPYSDNYLDDACVDSAAKRSFSGRFRSRLAGRVVPPANVREEAIWELVGLIESEYERADYPSVYASLLAIHRSQEESIRLMDRHGLAEQNGQPLDVTRLVFAKGGDSVLADAYLAAGRLTAAEARFAFEWGVLLQLGDDLQDVREDAAGGIRTLFSQAMGCEPLDELTNRTFHFTQRVMTELDELEAAPAALKELIQQSSYSLLIRAAGAARELYSRPYIARLETYSPFRFAFVDSRREQLARRQDLIEKLGEVFLAAEDDESWFSIAPRLTSVFPAAAARE